MKSDLLHSHLTLFWLIGCEEYVPVAQQDDLSPLVVQLCTKGIGASWPTVEIIIQITEKYSRGNSNLQIAKRQIANNKWVNSIWVNGQIAQPYYRNCDEGGCFDILGGSEYKFFQKLPWSPKSGESVSVTSQIPQKQKLF